MNNQDLEPLAAILAEMRDERIIRIGNTDVTRCLLRNLADRIERAAKNAENAFGMALAIEDGLHKRDKQSATCNVAAMRTALEEQLRYWHAHIRTRDEEEMRKRTEAALAAPPRNCDRFADCNSAWKAYNAIANRERLPGFDFWLFATAEGGAE